MTHVDVTISLLNCKSQSTHETKKQLHKENWDDRWGEIKVSRHDLFAVWSDLRLDGDESTLLCKERNFLGLMGRENRPLVMAAASAGSVKGNKWQEFRAERTLFVDYWSMFKGVAHHSREARWPGLSRIRSAPSCGSAQHKRVSPAHWNTQQRGEEIKHMIICVKDFGCRFRQPKSGKKRKHSETSTLCDTPCCRCCEPRTTPEVSWFGIKGGKSQRLFLIQ